MHLGINNYTKFFWKKETLLNEIERRKALSK